jgi:DNA-binding transcriptional MerR regulator
MTRKRTDRKLTIGDIATETGVSTDTLRYYEKMGLIAPIARTRAGYRIYCTDSIRIIRFIRGAKALNFTLDEIRQLMALDTSRQATCAQMHRRAQEKLHEAEQRIRELKAIKTRLSALVSTCRVTPHPSHTARSCNTSSRAGASTSINDPSCC